MRINRFLAGASLIAAMTAASASAQTTPAPNPPAPSDQAQASETSGPDIVVTGSYIAGTAKTTAIPVSVVSQADIERRGSPTVLELIKTLPISGPVFGDTNQFNATAAGRNGGGTMNLRGLGAQRTLVLLNGRRFVGGTADTNLLPLAAIGRVEILKDGAAATYGSDAIAGVTNFITRKNLKGVEVTGNYRLVPGANGLGGDVEASVLIGGGDDRVNYLLSAGYQHRAELSVNKRDFVVRPYPENPAGWSVLGNPGGFTIKDGPNGTGNTINYTVDANCDAVHGYSGYTGTTPVCYYNYLPFDNLIEKTHQYQFYGELNAKIGDETDFHVEAMFAETNLPKYRVTSGYPPTSGPLGPGSSNQFTIPSTNPGFIPFLQQTGQAALIGVAQSATPTLWRPIANGGNITVDGAGGQTLSRLYNELRISADVKGPTGIGGVNYEVAATYIREYQDQRTPDILINRLQRALNGLGGPSCTGTTPGANGCQYFNPFSNAYAGNPALGLTNPGYVASAANSKELVAWLFDKNIYLATQTTFVVDALLNGKLPINLPGGQVGFAVGAQYRVLDFVQSPGSPFADSRLTPCPVVGDTTCTFRTGPYIFLGQSIPLNLSQSVYAVFAELNVPVTDRLNGQFAIRYEDYRGQTGATVNPQFRGKWQALDWFALRGSVGTSFRGPTAGNVASTGSTGLQGIAAAGNNFKSIDFFGNPAVGPEKAFTYSVGGILETGGLTLTVDYWSYRVKDQITSVPANIIATAVAGVGTGSQFVNCASPLRSLITFDNNNSCIQGTTTANNISRVRSDTTNGPTLDINGIDFDLNYRINDVAGGRLDIGGSGSYLMHYKQAAFIYNGSTVSTAYDAAGFANYDRLPGTISKWRVQPYVNYSTGPHNFRWTINYVSGVDDNRGPTTVQTGPSTNCNVANARAGTAVNCKLVTFGVRLGAFMSHDVTYRVELPFDVTLTASVLNLFNQDPPTARLEYSYDPYIGNPIGRTYKIGLRKTF